MNAANDDQTVVWIAGTRWDGVAGTDFRLVSAMSRDRHVTWVDPPQSILSSPGSSSGPARMHEISERVTRLGPTGPPGLTRPGIRRLTAQRLERSIHVGLDRLRKEPAAVVNAFPLAAFPRQVVGTRVLYWTDDWISGASLMGFSRRSVMSALIRNLGYAHAVVATSPLIVENLAAVARKHHLRMPPSMVCPNGCPEPTEPVPGAVRDAAATVVGQLNERLDLSFLEAVRDSGSCLRIIGPRTDRDPRFRARLDRLLSSPNVEWLGAMSSAELARQHPRLAVGLTPYCLDDFNRASFPLKTLEYLSWGLPVVSTDIPAARWLDTPHVAIASDPHSFAELVRRSLEQRQDAAAETARREFARAHSWYRRSQSLQSFLAEIDRTEWSR